MTWEIVHGYYWKFSSLSSGGIFLENWLKFDDATMTPFMEHGVALCDGLLCDWRT